MWAMSITGHSISQWLPCPVPSWVPNTIGTWGGNSVKFSQLNSDSLHDVHTAYILLSKWASAISDADSCKKIERISN